MLKIVFTVDRSSALLQQRAERTEVMDLARLDLISKDVTEARRAVPAQRRQAEPL